MIKHRLALLGLVAVGALVSVAAATAAPRDDSRGNAVYTLTNAAAGNAVVAYAPTAGPAQVAFTPDGDHLVVSEKASSSIDVYTVGRRGLVGAPATSHAAGQTPFGFDFDAHGHLLTSDASGSASSYAVSDDGVTAI